VALERVAAGAFFVESSLPVLFIKQYSMLKLTILFLRRFFSPTLKGGTGGEKMNM
jgi:hypothetical protein